MSCMPYFFITPYTLQVFTLESLLRPRGYSWQQTGCSFSPAPSRAEGFCPRPGGPRWAQGSRLQALGTRDHAGLEGEHTAAPILLSCCCCSTNQVIHLQQLRKYWDCTWFNSTAVAPILLGCCCCSTNQIIHLQQLGKYWECTWFKSTTVTKTVGLLKTEPR